MKLYSSTAIADNRYIHICLILFVGILAYSKTFHVPFVLDDRISIVENHVIKSLSGFFANNAGFHYNPRRFVGYLSFALNYRLGGLDVTGYHIFNLAVHLLTSILLYFFVIFTFKTPALEKSSLAKSAPVIAITAALLFVAHPVQTQAVTYITQRLASLATMFYLLSVTFYARARLMQCLGSGRRWVFLHFSLAFAAASLAMFTKEIAFTLPIVILLYEFYFFPGNDRKKLLALLPLIMTMLIISFTMINTQASVGELLADIDAKLAYASPLPRTTYFLTQLCVITTYIRLLILPVNQNLDYSYPVYDSLLDPRVFTSAVLLLGLAVAALVMLQQSRRNHEPALRLISFGILWFFITLSVESSFIPITDVIFEHRLYLPSIGIFTAVATTTALIIGHRHRMHATAAVAVALFLAVVTWNRNLVWGDEVTLWRDTVSKSPLKARPHNNLGEGLSRQGKLDEAMGEILTALVLSPNNAEAISNLGSALMEKGDEEAAVKQLQKAAKLNSALFAPHYNLGIIYRQRNDYDMAIEQLLLALKINPDFAEAHNQLAVAYAGKDMLDKAIEHFGEAVRLQPDKAEYGKNLKIVLQKRS
jgi:tetratricopeptide (TPR) repeat protein